MLIEYMLQSLLQQTFKKASHSTDTSPEMSSPFVNRVMTMGTVCCTPDKTLSIRRCCSWSFKSFKSYWSGLCLSFCCKFFHVSVCSKSSNLYRFFKMKCDSLFTDPFPSTSSDVDGCNGNKVSWNQFYQNSSFTYLKLQTHWRFTVAKIINID